MPALRTVKRVQQASSRTKRPRKHRQSRPETRPPSRRRFEQLEARHMPATVFGSPIPLDLLPVDDFGTPTGHGIEYHLGDFDGDHRADLMRSDFRLLLGTGESFTPVDTPGLPASVAYTGDSALAVGDFLPAAGDELVLLGGGFAQQVGDEAQYPIAFLWTKTAGVDVPHGYHVPGAVSHAATNGRPLVARFNADARADIALEYFLAPTGAVDYAHPKLQIITAEGSGQLIPVGSEIALNASEQILATGNFAGDANIDILMGIGDGTNANTDYQALTVLIGDGVGGFTRGPTSTLDAPMDRLAFERVSIADLNGDGKDDMVDYNRLSGKVETRLNDGNGGGLYVHSDFFTSGTHREFALGDYSGDGKVDIVYFVLDSQRNQWYLNELQGDETGAFAYGENPPIEVPSLADAFYLWQTLQADFNGDGKRDVLALGSRHAPPQPAALFLREIKKFHITGTVSDDQGKPFEHFQVSLSDGSSVPTSADGSFSFLVPSGQDYEVTVGRQLGYQFNATNIPVPHLDHDTAVQFVGTYTTHVVQGNLKNKLNLPLADTIVRLTGDSEVQTKSDINGHFTFAAVPHGGNYTIATGNDEVLFDPFVISDLQSDQSIELKGKDPPPPVPIPVVVLTPGTTLNIGKVVISADSIALTALSVDKFRKVYELKGQIHLGTASYPDILTIQAARAKVTTNSFLLTLEIELESYSVFFPHVPIPGFCNGLIPSICDSKITLLEGPKTIIRKDANDELTIKAQEFIQKPLRAAGLDITIDKIFLHLFDEPGVTVLGQVQIPNIGNLTGLKATISNLRITRTNGIQVDGSITLPNFEIAGLGISDLSLSYFAGGIEGKVVRPDVFKGTGKISIPNIATIEGVVVLHGGSIESIGGHIGLGGSGIPIPPLLNLTGGTFEVAGLQTGNFSLFIGADITLINPFLKDLIELSNAGIRYRAPAYFGGESDLRLLTVKAARAILGIDLTKYSFEFGADVTLTDSVPVFLVGGRVKAGFSEETQGPYIEGSAHAKVQIPDGNGFPFNLIKGVGVQLPYEIASASVDFRNNAVTSRVSLPILGDVMMRVAYIEGSLQLLIAHNFPFLPKIEINTGAAGEEPTSRVGGVVVSPGTPKIIIRLAANSGATRFNLVKPDQTTITPENAADQQASFVQNLETGESFFVINHPQDGEWYLEADPSQGPFEFSGYGQNAEPTIDDVRVAPVTDGFTITYDVNDLDDQALVSLYYSPDPDEFSGTLIAENLPKGVGQFDWNPATYKIPSGNYYVYAVAEDGVNGPVRRYAVGSITVIDPLAPAQPQNVSAQSGGENSLRVSWDANTDTDLRGYTILFGVDRSADTEFTGRVDAGNVTSYRIPGLEENTAYRISVIAYDLNNEVSVYDGIERPVSRISLPSASAIATTGAAIAPVVEMKSPVAGSAVMNDNTLTVTWELTNADDLLYQEVDWSVDGGETFLPVASLSPSVRSYSWDLPAGMVGSGIQVQVRAVDAAGNEDLGVTTFETQSTHAPEIAGSGFGLSSNSIRTNETLTLNALFRDIDTGEAHTAIVNWGDGAGESIELAAGVFELHTSHVYAEFPLGTTSAEFVVALTLIDPFFQKSSGQQTVSVSSPSPPWQNALVNCDVDGDTVVAPIDVLLIINELNDPKVILAGGALPAPFTPHLFYDVNGDGFLAPIDALIVINFLNAEGEADGESGTVVSATAMTQPPSSIANPRVASQVDHLLASHSVRKRATNDVALAQLLDRSPRARTEAAPVLREKSRRLPERWLAVDAPVGIDAGDQAPGTRPTPARASSKPAHTALDAVLAEWDRDETLGLMLS